MDRAKLYFGVLMKMILAQNILAIINFKWCRYGLQTGTS